MSQTFAPREAAQVLPVEPREGDDAPPVACPESDAGVTIARRAVNQRLRSRRRGLITIAATAALVQAVVSGRSSSAPSAAAPLVRAVVPDGSQQPAAASGIYFTPTPEVIADAMLTLAGVTSRDLVYDLGSGDGRIVILAAQKYGARGVGIEIQPRLVELARQVAREGEVSDRATFIAGDLFEADIASATVVTLWLSASMNAELETKLRTELRPGARIVSRQFRIGRWPPEARVDAGHGEELFLWRVGR